MTDSSFETEKLQLIFENLQNDCEGTEERVLAAIKKVADVSLPTEIKCNELKGFVIRSARSRFDLLSDALAIRMAGGNVVIKEKGQESGNIHPPSFNNFHPAPIATTAAKEDGEGINADSTLIKEELSLFDKWQSKKNLEVTEREEIETQPWLKAQLAEKEKPSNLIVSDDSAKADNTENEVAEIRTYDAESKSDLAGNLFRWEVPDSSEESQKTLERPAPYGSKYTGDTVNKEPSENLTIGSERSRTKKRKIRINDPEMARLLEEYDRQRVQFPERISYIKKGCFHVMMFMGVTLGMLLYMAISR